MATLTPAKHDRRTDVVGIMLVDDHAIVRQGLRSILEREDDMRVVAEASTAAEAMAVVARGRPQIVLLDLKLSTSSDTEGLELCADLTAAPPRARGAGAHDVPRRAPRAARRSGPARAATSSRTSTPRR